MRGISFQQRPFLLFPPILLSHLETWWLDFFYKIVIIKNRFVTYCPKNLSMQKKVRVWRRNTFLIEIGPCCRCNKVREHTWGVREEQTWFAWKSINTFWSKSFQWKENHVVFRCIVYLCQPYSLTHSLTSSFSMLRNYRPIGPRSTCY